MKKSQIQSQIFIYLFAIIVLSMIILFGFKAIKGFKKDTDTVVLVTFQKDMQSYVAAAASEYDSVQIIELLLPREYKKVCFVDENTIWNNPIISPYPLIQNALKDGTDDNVFVVKKPGEPPSSFKTIKIDVLNEDNFICVENARGKIEFTLRGKSRYAEFLP